MKVWWENKTPIVMELVLTSQIKQLAHTLFESRLLQPSFPKVVFDSTGKGASTIEFGSFGYLSEKKIK